MQMMGKLMPFSHQDARPGEFGELLQDVRREWKDEPQLGLGRSRHQCLPAVEGLLIQLNAELVQCENRWEVLLRHLPQPPRGTSLSQPLRRACQVIGVGDLPCLKEDLESVKDPIACVRTSMPTWVMPPVNLWSRVHLVSFLSGPTWTC
jgi:hypothetical protein